MMRSRQLRIVAACCAVGLLSGVLLLGACSSSGAGGGTDDDGGSPLSGRSFTLDLGGGAVFDVVAGAEAVRYAFAVSLFDGTPTDSPSSCTLSVDAQGVQVIGEAGSITVATRIGASTSTNPCEDGQAVGSFTLSYDGQAVSLGVSELSLSGTALSYVSSGQFTLCLAASGDTDATLTIVRLGLRFGAESDSGDEDDTTPIVEPLPLDLGETVDLTTQTIGPDGGAIIVDSPGDPLDGFTIEVPEGAYPEPTTFTVSYKPITGHTLVNGVQPVSPLITVENGGQYADDILTVTIPVDIPEDRFAMAFYYDQDTGDFEGIPVLDQDATSLTIMTRHFSSSGVFVFDKSRLESLNLDSEFKPGRDDWQFANYGSVLAPTGHCRGMSLGAIWYFIERRRQGEEQLWGRYDNDLGPDRKTPDFWRDDDGAIKLCSVVQNRVNSCANQEIWKKIENEKIEGRRLTTAEIDFYCFAAAFEITSKNGKRPPEPQLMGIHSTTTGKSHALVCWAINGRTLHVADPNYPGQTELKIEFVDRSFTPYESADNTRAVEAGQTYNYDRVWFKGKTSDYQWSKIYGFWVDLEAGGIGDAFLPPDPDYGLLEGQFPRYNLRVIERDDANNITDNYELDLLNDFQTDKKRLEVELDAGFEGHVTIYRWGNLGTPLNSPIELRPGENLLGFLVTAKPETDADRLATADWPWVGFDWLHAYYEGEDECTIYIPMDPPAIGEGSWGIRYYDDPQCAGDVTGDTVWEFYSDGTIKYHWAEEPFDDYTWQVVGETITITIASPDVGLTTVYKGTVSDDCWSIECGTINTYGADWEIPETYWSGERRY
ncbi:MAG: hypothetical protein JSV19_08995 [Phycisphaerales bacterium]|nr:MAG: hypothetical protein JSV19_08995 [Phycisphaerales bacterium]